MSRSIRSLAIAAGLEIAALAIPGSASAVVSSQQCPTFQVVRNAPGANLLAGTYTRANHANYPTRARGRAVLNSSLTCDVSYHVFRSYLYDPESHSGWTVRALPGVAETQGRRFIKRGTGGRVYFDVRRRGAR
jgi:hypothetical protein